MATSASSPPPLWRRLVFLHFGELLSADSEKRVHAAVARTGVPLEQRAQSEEVAARLRVAYVTQRKSLARALVEMEARHVALCSALSALRLVAIAATPQILLATMTPAIDGSGARSAELWAKLAMLFACRVLGSLLLRHEVFATRACTMRVASGLQALVFESVLATAFEPDRMGNEGIADVMHTFETDVVDVGNVVASLHRAWSGVAMVAVEVYILLEVSGLSFASVLITFAAITLALLALSITSTHVLRGWMAKYNEVLNSVHECFKGVQMVKLNAWEWKLLDRIRKATGDFDTARRLHALVNVLLVTPFKNVVQICSAVVIGAMATEASSALTPARVFAVLVLIHEIKNRVMSNVGLYACLQECPHSLRKIDKLLHKYLVEQQKQQDEDELHELSSASSPFTSDTVIGIKNGCFKRGPGDAPVLLVSVNLVVQQGQLVVLYGKSGAGKSTLLRSLLDPTKPVNGRVFVRSERKIAYCPQEPWLQTLSIKENILFGSEYDEQKYLCVLDACCLLPDLTILPEGDSTKVGPKGVNLSGGQKARIALARACYSDADIYLLDCPLASVDAIVQSDIFRKCIIGLLRRKTIVLATHNQEIIRSRYIDSAVEIVDMSVAKAGSDDTRVDGDVEMVSYAAVRDFYYRRDMMQNIALAAVAAVCGTLLILAKDVWLMKWSAGDSEWSARSSFAVYAVLVVAAIGFALLGGVLTSVAFYHASHRYFFTMTRALLAAPMAFFYSTPLGEIMQRYLVDLKSTESDAATQVQFFLQSVATTSVRVGVLAYVLGGAGVAIGALIVFEITMMFPHRVMARVRQAILSSESRKLNFISEALGGASTIRGFGPTQVARFRRESGALQDVITREELVALGLNSFVLVRARFHFGLHLLVLGYVLATHKVSSAMLGLLLYYIINIEDDVLNCATAIVSELEYHVGVTRLHAYTQLESEESAHAAVEPPTLVAAEWPTRGDVVFDRVSFGYSSALGSSVALQNMSCAVSGGQKIGVVGRTGSGKSSVAMALFRLHPVASGRILIDGVDTSTLSLRTLRCSLSIIPEMPMFYRCSIRHYLDPFGEVADDTLWSAIHRCGLHSNVSSLDQQLSDNAENWSVGERQALCLARALLKPSRVLVLDEAFSALDQVSAKKLLAVAETSFARSTVFMISHHLDQMLQLDKIMVLAEGRMVEFGSMMELAGDPDSALYEFLEATLLTD